MAQTPRTIVNTGFEQNNPSGNPGFQFFSNAQVPGWQSTSGTIELWDSTFRGIDSFSGLVHAELNATSSGALFQEVCLVNGDVFDFTFAHRARPGGVDPENVTFDIGDSGGNIVQVLGMATTSENDTPAWNVIDQNGIVYTGPTGVQRVQFRTTDGGSSGNFLDDISIRINPFLELASPATSGIESSASADVVTLFVSGTVLTAFNAVVTVAGGTATIGTDYTTPSGTATFNVTIPPGNYLQVPFPLGINIVDDSDIESNETIDIEINPNPTLYTISNTNNCGGAGQATSTYTIEGNDSRITLVKQWLSAVVGDETTITASRNGTVVDTLNSTADSPNEADIDTSPTIAVFGETFEFAETIANTNAGTYESSFSCTGAADTNLSDGLTIATGEQNVSCTYTNTRSNLSLAKTVEVISDGVNATNPKAIPGAMLRYCILATNVGQTTAEAISALDTIPGDVTFVSGSMRSGTSCATATTIEDDDDVGGDESNPFGMSISGTTITGVTATLLPGATFAMVFDTLVN